MHAASSLADGCILDSRLIVEDRLDGAVELHVESLDHAYTLKIRNQVLQQDLPGPSAIKLVTICALQGVDR